MSLIGPPYTVLALLGISRELFDWPKWRIADLIPSLSLSTWIAIGLVILLAAALEGAYRTHESAKEVEDAKLARSQSELVAVRAESEKRIAELQAGGPTLILFTKRPGYELMVESLREDATNVRLVPTSRENYILSSQVVRNLRMGSPEVLILRCGYKDNDGSPIFSQFLTPLAFFADQSVVSLDLDYSDITGLQQYRSTFLVRWDEFNQSISDIAPKGTRRNPAAEA